MAERPDLDPNSALWKRWEEIDSLFSRALDIAPAERSRFLAESCSGDHELRDAVLELLELSETARDRLAGPGANLVRAAWSRAIAKHEADSPSEPDTADSP